MNPRVEELVTAFWRGVSKGTGFAAGVVITILVLIWAVKHV